MTGPAVSAVIIFLDAERWLAEAIASVRAQTFADWELLLVDDGSRDGGTALARAEAARDPDRVRYVEHPGHANRGMSAARNLGLRHARGSAVGFCDADDVWLPDKLARQMALLAAHPEAGMVASAMEYWFSWTDDPADHGRDHAPRSGIPHGTVIRPPELLLRLLCEETRSPGICSVLVRHFVATAVGGFEARFRGMYEDQAFLAKVCLTAPVLVTDDVVARYRQHPGSCYARARANGTASAAELVYLEWLAREVFGRHARERGAGWDTLRAILQRHRHPRRWRLVARGRRLAAALRARTRLAPLR
jgi:glycosyltransferase involved in cell wall biosynthesis